MIDTYVQTIKLWYAYLLEQRKQIFSKLKRPILCALNMKEKNTQGQIGPLFDLYRDSQEDVMDSNIDDWLTGRNNLLQPSKLSTPALWPERAVLLLSELLGNNNRATSSKKNNSRSLPTGNLSHRLPPSILPLDLLSTLFKSNDCRL